MNGRIAAVVFLVLAVSAALAWMLLGDDTGPAGGPPGSSGGSVAASAGPDGIDIGTPDAVDPVADAGVSRTAAELDAGAVDPTGVRGRVVDARTLEPLAGIEVRAMREPPGVERLLARFRGAFFRGEGFWTETAQPPRILGSTTTAADGTFELRGLEPGVVFLDGRSDFAFVRSPGRVRLARGEFKDGVELLGSPGGRIQGVVLDPEGTPASGTVVSVRPGLNAFLGQITQRKYRWLEAVTDAEGRFDLPGVPAGSGYSLSAGGPLHALEEVHSVEVREGQVTWVEVQGNAGATVAGRVTDPTGEPVAGANVAMVYLDVSRVLFSADGRTEPIETDADGRFALHRVAAGRVAFVAAADGLAPSTIEEMAVVDGGVYDELELVLGEGEAFGGLVVDDTGKPLPGARVEIRPMERPNDPDMLKMALKIRSVETETELDGRFAVRGIVADRLFVQVSKPGYVTNVQFGAKLEEREIRIELTRGVTVTGIVADSSGEPITRFRVNTRSRRPRSGDEVAAGADNGGERRRGPPWARGGRGRWGRGGSMQLREGQTLGDRRIGDNWEEVGSADGRFELDGLPPGEVRVRIRADGFRDPESQTITLAAGEGSDELKFTLEAGAIARGTVVDEVTGAPVADAEVTAYRSREGGRGRGPFRASFDREDFDFLGFGAASGGADSTARTDSDGRFEIRGLAAGKHRFTARHPDLAKATAKDVEIATEGPTDGIVIEIGEGGGIEGRVTGAGSRPLVDALVVAASLSAGSFKSSSSDSDGNYAITGLPPGQYIVFKSRMDERSTNLGYDLMGNMRLKTVTVRKGKRTRLDIHDETENSVRVFGVVRDGAEVVSRAMVTAIGSDRDGIFGMGVRAQPTDRAGEYELIGLQPGDYYFQVTRFRGRPEQASLSVEVPEGVREYRVDLDLPQSYVAGRVVDAAGQPVAGIRVAAGVEEGGMDGAPGLLGLIMKNGVANDRTDENGEFKLERMSQGVYRVTASGRPRGGRRSRSPQKYGEVAQSGVNVMGGVPVEGLLLTIPEAGSITGFVLDGSGNPVAGAELHYSREDGERTADPEKQMLDLFGMQSRPSKSDRDGRFELTGVTPGRYRVRADADGLSPGVAEDVVVAEAGTVEVTITVVTGATLRVRARNIDGSMIPFANITVLDGTGKPLASKLSVTSVFRRLMGAQQKKKDTGWYEVGSIPPDTYTVIVREPGKDDVEFTREVIDGETVEWDIDLAAELKAAGRDRK